MILIADGGSTKVDWIAIDDDGNELLKFRTLGLNPDVLTSKIIKDRIEELVDIKSKVNKLYFYGAGCGSPNPVETLRGLFQDFFRNAEIYIAEDILGAVHACTTKPGIICILGTGSNSCYFDGDKIHSSVCLGYSVMDEASGNYFGKQLLRDYFYGKMPQKLANAFEQEFNLDPDYIKRYLYQEPNPNQYLATFTRFMANFSGEDYVQETIEEGIEIFFKNWVLKYKTLNLPVHFVGSIAYYFRESLIKVAKKYNMNIGNVIQRPIDSLVAHHTKNKG